MDQQSLIGEDITFVERHISEELTVTMEQLIDAHAVSGSAPSRSKDPWMISVVDESYHHHVQVSLSGDRIKSYSCNCKAYQSGHLCAHVCASLVHIRSERSVAETDARPAKRKGGRRGSSALKKVLTQLSKDDLHHLVKDFAQRDETIRLILFGRYYMLLSSDEQQRIIERSFPAMTRVDQRIGQKYISSFIAFTTEILTTHSGLLTDEDYVSAYEMLFPVLKKSFYIKSHLSKENSRLLDNHHRLIERFLEMTVLIDAPDLRHSMNDQLLELLSSSYISANTSAEQKIWLYIYLWPEPRARLTTILQQMVDKGKGDDIDTYYFAQAMLLLMATDRQDMILGMDSQARYRVVQYLLLLTEIDEVSSLLRDFVLYSDMNGALLRQVLERLTEHADSLIDRLMDIYRRQQDAHVLEWLHRHCADGSALCHRIRESAEISGYVRTMMDYLLLTDMMDEAMRLLAEQRSMPLLRRYDRQLLPSHGDDILQLYKMLCSDYIQEHFGGSSREYLSDIYQHLRVIGGSDILKKLQTHIKAEFKNRRSLKVE